jgi:PAS domain S-box-containing protein
MKPEQSIAMPGVVAHAQNEAPVSTAKKVKILLVDDAPDNLVSLGAALDTLSEELVYARSGKEALRHLLADDFAAILLDVKMPDMDGFETAELIRSRPKSRHTPILFLTGFKNEEHLFRGYDLGAVDYLFKPIVPEVLRSKVAVFVELSRRADQLQEQAKLLVGQTATLQKAEQRFRRLLEAAPDAMVICRENGEIVLVNTRTESMFGHSQEELLGQHIRLLVPEWTYDLPWLPDEDAVADPIPLAAPRELNAVHRDGHGIPVEISASPLEVDEGLLITSAIRDISERKKAEQARAKVEEEVRLLNSHLEELNAHLEERVLARTEELRRSNEELAQFAYVASHDLQEPLRTVSVYTQLLARHYGSVLNANGDARLFMEFITESAQRMEYLIRDLLRFSQIDCPDVEQLISIDSKNSFDEAITNLKTSIDEHSATISHDPLPQVKCDPIQLTRLFQNLISNAIKYRNPDQAPVIRVSARLSGREWCFSIADNGIGIDPQYAERVFGIFKRLHGRDNPGTGIGLAICKKIVARHGGRIWVESQLGAGATFHFTLPGEMTPQDRVREMTG